MLEHVQKFCLRKVKLHDQTDYGQQVTRLTSSMLDLTSRPSNTFAASTRDFNGEDSISSKLSAQIAKRRSRGKAIADPVHPEMRNR